jgi:hypothetical protein
VDKKNPRNKFGFLISIKILDMILIQKDLNQIRASFEFSQTEIVTSQSVSPIHLTPVCIWNLV